MKAKEGVIQYLNEVLRAELTAVHQYLLHAALCKHWGYERLHSHFEHLAHEEVEHSSLLIDHILYLEGTPEVAKLDAVAVGRDAKSLFESDLAFERQDVGLLCKAVAHCAQVGDYTSRHLLEHMVIDSEEHIDWFEIQLKTIGQIGLERYLSEQVTK